MLHSSSLLSLLPFDLIREILLYDRRFVIRKNQNRLVCINKISNLDQKKLILNNIPKIYELAPNNWSVILGTNKRFVIKHYLRPSGIWEYSFSIFTKDQHTNIFNYIPDSLICIPLFSL
jgi:hypothetical protein